MPEVVGEAVDIFLVDTLVVLAVIEVVALVGVGGLGR
jgi:hypothetical protein